MSGILPCWAYVEFVKRRGQAGYVDEVEIAGVRMLEIKTPGIGSRCPRCLGSKRVEVRIITADMMIRVPCPTCDGMGLVDKTDPEWIGSRFLPASLVFSLSPVSETEARAISARSRAHRGPVEELPPLPEWSENAAASLEGVEAYVDHVVDRYITTSIEKVLSDFGELTDGDLASARILIRMRLEERGWGADLEDESRWRKRGDLDLSLERFEIDHSGEQVEPMTTFEVMAKLGRSRPFGAGEDQIRQVIKRRGWIHDEKLDTWRPPFDGETIEPPAKVLEELDEQLEVEATTDDVELRESIDELEAASGVCSLCDKPLTDGVCRNVDCIPF